MVIMVSRQLRISAEDGLNYTVQRLRVGVDGAGRWVNAGYYSNLGQAAVAVLNKGLAQADKRAGVEKLARMHAAAVARILAVCEGAMSGAHAAEYEGEVTAGDLPDELFAEAG